LVVTYFPIAKLVRYPFPGSPKWSQIYLPMYDRTKQDEEDETQLPPIERAAA
jgi:hypothetical protein